MIYKITLLLFAVFSSSLLLGSQPYSDKQLIEKKILISQTRNMGSKPGFLETQNSSFLARFNPLTLSMGGLMFFYQRLVSPQLTAVCHYEHSCSSFSKKLISEYGMGKGIITTSDRLMRCNRLGAMDINPLFVNTQTGKVKEEIDIYR